MPEPPILKIGEIKLRRNFIEGLPANPNLKELSRQKRKAGYLPEVLFWMQVHKRKFHGVDFDRQRIIGNYIVDFYIKTLGVVIEIDGNSHVGNEEEDDVRQNYLESFGIKVYRISNNDILKRIDSAMNALKEFLLKEFGE